MVRPGLVAMIPWRRVGLFAVFTRKAAGEGNDTESNDGDGAIGGDGWFGHREVAQRNTIHLLGKLHEKSIGCR